MVSTQLRLAVVEPRKGRPEEINRRLYAKVASFDDRQLFESVVGMPQTDSSIAAPNGCSKLLISRALFAALIVAVAFGAYSEIAMVRVEARSTVSAPASVLWKIMTEVDKYPEWYSAVLEAGGTPRLGSKLRFRVKAVDGSTRQFSFTGIVVEFEPVYFDLLENKSDQELTTVTAP